MKLLSAICLCFSLAACSEPPPVGVKSNHFDGKVFSSPEPIAEKSFWDVLKWRLTSQRAAWPKWITLKHNDKPPAHVDGSALRVSLVNHATVLLQTRGLNILTDPIWSMRASPLSFIGPKRVHAPGIVFNDLPRIDVVLISHSHYDHLDIPTLKKLVARDNPLILTGLGVDRIIKRHIPHANVIAHDWHDMHNVNENIVVHFEPAQHWSARSPWDRNKTLWTGFLIDTPDGKIYYSGDTGFGSGKIFRDTFARHGKLRLALLPIGAYEPRWFMKDSHMNPDEAVQAFTLLHAEQAVGVHFGTFQLTDEAIDVPTKDLAVALKKNHIEPHLFRALTPGDHWEIH